MSTSADTPHRWTERQRLGQNVFRSDSFEVGIYEYLDSEHRDTMHQSLNEPRFPVGSTDVSSRVLHHWEEEGVADDPRTKGQGWRRYSVLEVLWLQIALRLRKFGLPVQSLIRARHTMNEAWSGMQTEGDSAITLFEIYVLHATRGIPVYLLVFEDGTADLATEGQYEVSSSLFGLGDHVRIEINRIIQDTFPGIDWPEKQSELRVSVTKDELNVLSALSSGKYESITVTLSDGKVKTIHSTEDVRGKRIHEILDTGDFQDIEIKKRDGQIVHLRRTLLTRT